MQREPKPTDEFAHGTAYGDYSGVIFYGPAVNGPSGSDSLLVSNVYIHPLFHALLDRAQFVGGAKAPKLLTEWNEGTGWEDATGAVEMRPADAADLADALAAVSAADLAPHAAKYADDCLRCAAAIAGFLRGRVGDGRQLYIEND